VAIPRILLVVAAVAAVLVGSGALARTLPFRPIALPAPADDNVPASPTAAGGAAPAQRGAAPSPSLPAGASSTASPSPAAEEPLDATPTADPDQPSASPPAPEPVTIAYEAEQAELSGFVRLFEVEQASGGDVVGMIGPEVSSHVRFPEVTVDTAGEYELTLYYVSAPDREAAVTVNGAEPVVLDFPGLGDNSAVGSVSMSVELAAGPNVIWFGNGGEPAPALDCITITG
jgi:hypothetical protein